MGSLLNICSDNQNANEECLNTPSKRQLRSVKGSEEQAPEITERTKKAA